jgi:hypothetical protein
MPKQQIVNYAPDADLVVIRDRSTGNRGPVWTLQIDTKIDLTEDQADELDKLLNDKSDDGRRTAYERVYSIAQNDLNRDGPALAMIQAAFGLLGAIPNSKLLRKP